MSCVLESDLSVALISRENVPVVWLLVRQRIEKAIKDTIEGIYDATDLFDELITGKAQLWLVTDTEMNIKLIALTKVICYPKKKRLLIDLLVGEGLREAKHLLEFGAKWAREKRISQYEVHCLPGIERMLRGTFKTKRVVMLRDI